MSDAISNGGFANTRFTPTPYAISNEDNQKATPYVRTCTRAQKRPPISLSLLEVTLPLTTLDIPTGNNPNRNTAATSGVENRRILRQGGTPAIGYILADSVATEPTRSHNRTTATR